MIDNTTPLPLLHQLAASTRLILDVTAFDLSALPSHIKCHLVSRAASFSAPQLRTSGDSTPSARRASAPN